MIQLLRFSVVGAVGFCVDATILYGLLLQLDVEPIIARVPSFLCAATTTWILNRKWTFFGRKEDRPLRQWSRYTLGMFLGGALNYLCYALIVLSISAPMIGPFVGLVVGSLAGLALNYTFARYLVFRT